ncbi:hypothetical protein P3339_13905 [Microbulbifer sp. MLAF003]|uniref:hypothetical protein n=1 Tax=Microbulbifer sp. MLAF003 TaxID=3032582 RepID=UPI0024AD4D9D|nr:hypothetical protein [Microbulbifer sp. MLAF003]WHI49564.1 hypothetical protein P3339_13905 [Microbulbifer sp. MLAF003]
MKKLLIFFAAGCLGAVANSVVVWLFGDFGITPFLGVSITPSLSAEWLYPRVVWGVFGGFFYSSLLVIEVVVKRQHPELAPHCVPAFCGFSGDGWKRYGWA